MIRPQRISPSPAGQPRPVSAFAQSPAAGLIRADDLIELGSALRRGVSERKKRTVFKTVGVAAQDWAIASLLARKFLPNQ
jgi:ornithine cyclodeaminase/alanine dehydrogenase-like protein (mu-crystallin family)